MKKIDWLKLMFLLLMMGLVLISCTSVEEPEWDTLPDGAIEALIQEIQTGASTYLGPFDLKSVLEVDSEISRIIARYCVVTTDIPKADNSPTIYRHYIIEMEYEAGTDNELWFATTQEESSRRQWEWWGCTNWDS